jgi:arsenite oxidase small subunit
MTGCKKLAELGRRQFLSGGAGAAAMTAAAVILPTKTAEATPSLARVTYPSAGLGNVKDLKVSEPKTITYPDATSPGVLIKLGQPAEGGVGPDHDIVAFSTLCPHKGYLLNYVADDKTLNCPMHYSRFDCEKAGFEIWGHATQNLAQFRLRVDEQGAIYAEAVDELIYGRYSNILAV